MLPLIAVVMGMLLRFGNVNAQVIKGIGSWCHSEVVNANCSWYYGWVTHPDVGVCDGEADANGYYAYPNSGIEWVPAMLMDESTPDVPADLISYFTTGYQNGIYHNLIGHSEPKYTPSNMQNMISQWPAYESTGLRLTSPSLSCQGGLDDDGVSRPWLAEWTQFDDWFDRMAANGLRCDVWNIHYYYDFTDPKCADWLRDILVEGHNRYGLPVWITEIAPVMTKAWYWPVYDINNQTEARAIAAQNEMEAMMCSLGFVERTANYITEAEEYSYGNIFDGNGNLTPFGTNFINMSCGGIVSPISTPKANAATNISASTFFANWHLTEVATGYSLDVATNSTFNSYIEGYKNKITTFNFAPVSGLSPNTTYYYRVRAFNATDTSSYSDTILVTTLLHTPAPKGCRVSNIRLSSFTANWGNSLGASSYLVDLSTVSNFSTFVTGYQSKDVGNTFKLQLTGLELNTTYYFRVRAVDSVVSDTSLYSVTIPVTTLETLAAPVAKLENVYSNSFIASWDTCLGATGYLFDMSKNIDFSSSLITDSVVGNVTQLQIKGLENNTNYYFRLRAIDTISGIKSFYSDTITATTFSSGTGIVSGSVYKIINVNSGKALNVTGNSTENGANVDIYTYNGATGQQWTVTSVGGGNYKLIAKCSGMALDVADGSTADGGNVQQWTYEGNTNPNNQWQIIPVKSGVYKLIVQCSGKALDVSGGDTADGTNVQQWEDNGSEAQQWTFIPTGINDLNNGVALKVYPNPASTNAYLEYSLTSDAVVTVEIINISGKVVRSQTKTSVAGINTVKLPLESLGTGLYFIKVTSAGVNGIVKLNVVK